MARFTKKLFTLFLMGCLVCSSGAFAERGGLKGKANARQNPQIILTGTVTKFKEFETLVVEDANGKVNIIFQDKLQPLDLSVGEEVTISGQYRRDRNGTRQVIANSIRTQNRLIQPRQS